MVLGIRSSGTGERERIRGSILTIHTGHQIRQKNYTRYNRLTLAPCHIDDCSIDTGGLDRGGSGDTVALSNDSAGHGQQGRL